MARSFQADEELSEFFTKLWRLDAENRCINGTHFEINKQGWAKFDGDKDNARQPLFTWLSVEKVACKPTFKAFYALLDNYVAKTGVQEQVTDAEVLENRQFIDAIMETEVMQEAHKFLAGQNKAPRDVRSFKHKLYDLWFKLYRRTKGDRDFDSSGFEHVFVGEVKDTAAGDDQVMGFHNWLQMYRQEQAGLLNYMGYYGRRRDDDDPDPRLITVKFQLAQEDDDDAATKPKGSSFLGTTPEFEMALYTVCFLIERGNKIPLQLDDVRVEVNVHRIGPNLGSAYPIAR